MSAKVEYIRERDRGGWHPPGHRYLRVTRGLPFYQSGWSNAGYVHRVRSATHHLHDDQFSHTSLQLWCGMLGSIGGYSRRGKTARLLAECPDDALVCATCEGRAIGSGQLGSAKINGRMVRFSPRRTL